MFEAALRSLIRRSVGHRGPPLAFLEPPGDPGLFGPDSAIWQIHADFVSMMVGGMRALMLQALHPRALAGVWDHSDFRSDLSGRLSRTAYFIAATTYGSQSMAEAACGYTLALYKKQVLCDRMVRRGEWYKICSYTFEGSTIGIVGLGNIGRRVAKMMSGWPVKLIGYDPDPAMVAKYRVK